MLAADPKFEQGLSRFYGVMVSTLDSESSDPSSSLGRTFFLYVMKTYLKYYPSYIYTAKICFLNYFSSGFLPPLVSAS